MKHTVYFLITPKPELVSRFQCLAGEDFCDLLQPIMWSGSEFDKTSLQHADLDVLVKIFFLDMLHRERRTEIEFLKVFPEMVVSADYFDSLWSIQRVQLDMSIEIAIEDAIESGTINSIESSNNEQIEKVLAYYRSKKSTAEK